MQETRRRVRIELPAPRNVGAAMQSGPKAIVHGVVEDADLVTVQPEAQASVLSGEQSLKATLDCDWDDPSARTAALGQVLAALGAVETWLDQQTAVPEEARSAVAVAETVRDQDVEILPDNVRQLRRGVAKDRRISVEDPAIRHGRKSRSHL